MARKRDPILVVLAYFEEAPLEVAEQGLALARAIVQKRRPLVRKRVAKIVKERFAGQPAGGESPGPRGAQVPVGAQDSALSPKLPRQRLRKPQEETPTAHRKEEDVALPGILTEVGD